MDDAWVDEVRRWYYGGEAPAADATDKVTEACIDIGYEAAHPSAVNSDTAPNEVP